jgi:sentrin-specific protease 7
LRDYLTCEYKAKFPHAASRQFDKTNFFGNHMKVPQQHNFSDSGVFLLQYVEQFFVDPIKDFKIPITSLIEWFHQDVVTRKREEIAKILQELIKRNIPEGLDLPNIEFPTKDGRILD